MTGEKKQQFVRRITEANKTELVVILYEMTLEYLSEAEAFLDKNEENDFHQSIRRTRGCIKELMASLHFEYSPARELLKLYIFINRQLTLADINHEKEPIKVCKKIIDALCKAYTEVSQNSTEPPVMENSQTVYAGLTYGRNSLNENLDDQGSRRGFRV